MRKIDGICYIIAACKEFSADFELCISKNDLVIAADGGYDLLNKLNIKPDVLLGDFDSIDKIPDNENLIKYPSEKDDTDTFLAYEYGFNKGYKNFVIIGGIGGRIDHTIANIRTLSSIAKNGGRGFLLGNDSILTVIRDRIEFPESSNGYISVFSTEEGTKVTENGLKYIIQDTEILPDSTLGTSNEFIGERAQISVNNGSLLVIWYENNESFLKNIKNHIKKEL